LLAIILRRAIAMALQPLSHLGLRVPAMRGPACAGRA